MNSLKQHLQKISPDILKDWEMIRSNFFIEKIKKGDYYIKEGGYSNKVSFIESGLFKLFYSIEGSEKIMMFFSENQFVSDYFGYLTQKPSIRPIQAIEDSILYSITRGKLNHLFETYKTWEKIGRIFAERAYVIAVQRANRLIHDDFDTRFDSFLKEYPDLVQRVPQYMIASYLDMTPETLSRVKKRMMKNTRFKKSIHDPLESN